MSCATYFIAAHVTARVTREEEPRHGIFLACKPASTAAGEAKGELAGTSRGSCIEPEVRMQT